MSFNLEWAGRATDYDPSLLKTLGKPGPIANVARDAIWESVQKIAENDSGAWVRVTVSGWEESGKPGIGRFTLAVNVLDTDSDELQQRIFDQQPVDLRT